MFHKFSEGFATTSRKILDNFMVAIKLLLTKASFPMENIQKLIFLYGPNTLPYEPHN